jgi:hypothetical protein
MSFFMTAAATGKTGILRGMVRAGTNVQSLG